MKKEKRTVKEGSRKSLSISNISKTLDTFVIKTQTEYGERKDIFVYIPNICAILYNILLSSIDFLSNIFDN